MKKAATDVYGAGVRGSAYVPFDHSLVAEPPMGHRAIVMLDALPPEIASRYANLAALLLPEDRQPGGHTALCRRFDQVMGPSGEWALYLRRPEVRSLWELAPEEDAICTMAIAAVEKSSGVALRKINMSVPFNTVACTVDELMGHPVDYGLVGGGRAMSMHGLRRFT